MPGCICPPWIGRLLICPLRALAENPRKILEPYVREGMRVADLGCGMGFFTLPLARMVGSGGKVYAIDVQEAMIRNTRRRARRKGFADRIEARLCSSRDIGLDGLAGTLDFVLAAAVVHEVPDPAAFMEQVAVALRPGGMMLLAEPAGHVTGEAFDVTLDLAAAAGLVVTGSGRQAWNHTAFLHRAE